MSRCSLWRLVGWIRFLELILEEVKICFTQYSSRFQVWSTPGTLRTNRTNPTLFCKESRAITWKIQQSLGKKQLWDSIYRRKTLLYLGSCHFCRVLSSGKGQAPREGTKRRQGSLSQTDVLWGMRWFLCIQGEEVSNTHTNAKSVVREKHLFPLNCN